MYEIYTRDFHKKLFNNSIFSHNSRAEYYRRFLLHCTDSAAQVRAGRTDSATFLPVQQARILQQTCGEKLKVLHFVHFAQNWPFCVRYPLTIRASTSRRNFTKFDQRGLFLP